MEADISAFGAPAVVILAAGMGTRMKSSCPKVLHELMGRPLLTHVLNAARYLAPVTTVVVIGHGAREVEAMATAFDPKLSFVRQPAMLGTGHAVACSAELLANHKGPVVIMPGDAPLISPQTLLDLMSAHRALSADLSVLTVRLTDPKSYGRIIRDSSGWLDRIVEARDASEEEKSISEINSGIYVVDGPLLFESLASLKPDNEQHEYYLTDVVADFRKRGHLAAAVEGPDPLEISGINDRIDLARAQEILRARINEAWLLAGVTMQDPSTTYIEAGVRLARDVVLGPGVILAGNTRVEEGAFIGPYSCLRDVEVSRGEHLGSHLSLDGRKNQDSCDLKAKGTPGSKVTKKALPAARKKT